jgi:hypothetical protein
MNQTGGEKKRFGLSLLFGDWCGWRGEERRSGRKPLFILQLAS